MAENAVTEEDLTLGKECYEATTRKQAREGTLVDSWPTWESVSIEVQRTYQRAALVEGSPLLEERAAAQN